MTERVMYSSTALALAAAYGFYLTVPSSFLGNTPAAAFDDPRNTLSPDE